ncbi:hypothetical protein [Ottowia testudinis]|uniref:Uncharacterized protein n=1 Tax=Ottowia testudinis TaxID=2816950 RepID=A0A975CGY2_9BURK|nr:hypothetical protein [Ottowia testudinis]QTD45582.1 hypothetical protein J1M35_01235 [Ottowia testudinis]
MLDSKRSNQATYLILIALILCTLVFSSAITGVGNYALDDAYIVEHSVKGILINDESRFIKSTPWEGVTSPVYVALVTSMSLVMPLQLAHWVVGVVSTLLLVSGWYLVFLRYSINPVASAVAVGTGIMAGMSFYQLNNGLETGLAMAAATWTLLALDYDVTPRWGYILAGVQFFIRPELAALSGIFFAIILARRSVGWKKGGIIALCSFAIPATFIFLLTGALVSNTLSAKTYFFAEGCRPDALKLNFALSAVSSFIGSLGVFSIGFVFAILSRQRVALIFFALIFFIAYYKIFPGALFHNYHRYLYLLLPIAIFGWAAYIGHKNRKISLSGYVLGAVASIFVVYSSGSAFRFYLEEVRVVSLDNLQMSHWVERHVPQGSVVMVHDAGKISTVGEQPLVDLVGLKSAYSMAVHRQTTFKNCQRIPEAISNIAKNARASYMVVTADWDRIFGISQSLEYAGWSVERADTERGNSIYRVYKITYLN